MKKKFSAVLKIVAVIFLLAALLALCVLLIPMVLSLRESENQVRFHEFIDSLGAFGVLTMLVLQIIQITVAIIPGEPIEILMGLMYGTLGGLALTLLGIAIGQTLVFFAVKKFGIKLAEKFVDVKKFENLSFLNSSKKRDSLIFILFFIPGTPKDVLTYFAPFTGIGFRRFIVISTLARIPSVVSSTWAGASISDGSFLKTLIIFAVTGIVGIAGILINNKISNKQNKETK